MFSFKKISLIFLLFSSFLFSGNYHLKPLSKAIAIEDKKSLLNNFYLSLAYSYYKHKNISYYEKLSSNALNFALGYSFNKYLALELRYTKSSKIDYKSLNQAKKLNSKFSNLSLFTKLSYPVSNFKPYILLGYGKNKITNLAKANRVEYSFEYGVGLEYRLNKNISFFADYTRLYNKRGFDGRAIKDKQKINLITTGLIYKF